MLDLAVALYVRVEMLQSSPSSDLQQATPVFQFKVDHLHLVVSGTLPQTNAQILAWLPVGHKAPHLQEPNARGVQKQLGIFTRSSVTYSIQINVYYNY